MNAQMASAGSKSQHDWDLYFIEIAKVVASASKDTKTKVGSIIVDSDHRILSTGYNGTPPGFNEAKIDWNDSEYKKRVVIHSEQNAIIRVDGRLLKDATLYCTHSPCPQCCLLIAAAGIKRVVFWQLFRDISGLVDLTEFGVSWEGV